MAKKPTYEELEQRVKELEKEAVERKRAKEALKSEKDKLQALMDGLARTQIGVDIVGTDYKVLFQNQTLKERFGDLTGELCHKKYMELEKPCDFCPMIDAIKSGKVESVQLTAANGRNYELFSASLPNPDGTVEKVIEVVLDTTERKRAEEKIEHLNLVLRAIRNVNQLISKEKDPDRLLKGICDSLIETRGYHNAWIALIDKTGVLVTTAEAGLGKDFLPTIDSLERGELTDCAQRALKQSEAVVTEDPSTTCTECPLAERYAGRGAMTVRLEYGGKVHGLLFASIPGDFLPDGEEQSLFEEIAGDIAFALHSIELEREHKQTEEALRESEEKYRTLFENSRDAIFINAKEGKFIDVNQSYLDLFGYTREEMAERNATDDYANPDDRIRFSNELDRKGSLRDFEVKHKKKDGTEMDCLVTTAVRKAEDGSILAYQGIIRDITEKKKLEAQLERSQKMETVGTLAGGVAHDLNNILSGLVSYPELLLLEIPEDSPLRNPILTIQKSGQKAAAIVEDLLTLARRGVSVTEVVNLNLIVSEYVKSPEHERTISFHPRVDVRTNLEADLLNIIGSPAHLSKTVMNLTSNAAEAMLEGGTISISTENRYIDKPIRGYDSIEEGDYVILAVSDTGAGIIPTDMERIFEPFYTKKVMGRSGTGLGMSVVWGTVKDHEGYIDIETTEGKGTTFTLYFPVTRKELGKDKSLVPIEDYMGKGESILVIDDVEEQREIASKMLKKLGYSFTTVSSGEDAVDYLKENSADLLILDMIMEPGIDGLETYERIIELHPGQKALIVSGFSETKRVKKAQKLGAGAYVKKPFLLQKIGIAVRDELEK